MCNKKETYIGRTIGDNTKRFKVRINQHISDCKTRASTCEIPRHVYYCGTNNKCLEETFFSLYIMLRLNDSDRLETIEKYLYLKGYDAIKNPGRILTINITNQISFNLLSFVSLNENLSDYCKHTDEKF